MINIIKKESLDLDSQIRFLISYLKRESETLTQIEKQLDNPALITRDLIVERLADSIIKYSNTRQELIAKLEESFKEEQEKDLPRSFIFHKVYKQLMI